MPKNLHNTKIKTKDMSGRTDKDICFVISPIGKEGTKEYTDFKEILEFVIKPAIEESEYKYTVVRADDINRTGSFIKDILDSILYMALTLSLLILPVRIQMCFTNWEFVTACAPAQFLSPKMLMTFRPI